MANGQRSKECCITGCDKKGRVLARMGTIELAYCPKHRKKYGERIINALINSRFNYKLTNFLTDVKTKIFMSDEFFCEGGAEKLKEYIIEKTEELEAILEYQEENAAELDYSLDDIELEDEKQKCKK